MRRNMRKELRRLTAVCLALCLSVGGTFVSAADEAVASAMKLTATEGTVAVENKNGKGISVIPGMKLYSGYRLATEAASYAYISLDAVKAVKLDAVSEAEIRQKGKQLEVLLEAGNLFFNVAAPLKADETLNIRTSTMVTGIRGTCGWVKKIDENVSRLYILEGHVSCSVTNPVTGKVETVEAGPGQTVIFTAGSDGSATVTVGTFTEADVEGFVAAALRDDPVLQQTIARGGIFDVPLIIGRADETLKRDQLLTGQALEEMAKKLAGQSGGSSVTEVFRDTSSSRGTSGSGGGSHPGGTVTPGDNPGESGRTMVQRTLPISASELNTLLQTNDVTLSASGTSNTLTVDSGVTVPAGAILNIGAGIGTQVQAGQTLRVDGSLTSEGGLTNAGTLTNTSANTLKILRRFANSGTFTNTGRLIAPEGVSNTGTFINQNILEAGAQIVNSGGVMELGGTVTGDVSSAAKLAVSGILDGNVESAAEFTVTGTLNGNVDSRAKLILEASGRMNGEVLSSAEFIMTGGAVRTVRQEAGVLTVNGGEIENGITLGDGGHLILNGGTVSGGTAAAAILYGGTAGTSGPTVELVGGTVDGGGKTAVSQNGGSLILRDTVIRAGDALQFIRGGEAVSFQYEDREGVLRSGDLGFIPICTQEGDRLSLAGLGYNLASVLSEAQEGETVVMREDGTLRAESGGSGDTVVVVRASAANPAALDLNGCTLTLGSGHTLSVGMSGAAGGLEIRDSGTGGAVEMESESRIYLYPGGALSLEGVALHIADGGADSPICNSRGTLAVTDTEISGEWKGESASSSPLISLDAGEAVFENSQIIGSGELYGAVISASGFSDKGTVRLDGTAVSGASSRPVIEIRQKTELTVGEGTEITGSTADGMGLVGVTVGGATQPLLVLSGGLIRNEGVDGAAISWSGISEADIIFPQPEELGTQLRAVGTRDWETEPQRCGVLSVTSGFWTPAGYEVAQTGPDSDGKYHYELVPAVSNLSLLMSAPEDSGELQEEEGTKQKPDKETTATPSEAEPATPSSADSEDTVNKLNTTSTSDTRTLFRQRRSERQNDRGNISAPGAGSAMDVICAPAGITRDENGNLLVTDTYNKVIWRVTGGTGAICAGAPGARDLYGEPMGGYFDGAPEKALFKEPWGIAPFLDGYAVSDSANHAVRLINASGVRTAVGSGAPGLRDGKGTNALFDHPAGLAADEAGNLYIADTNNQCIRKVTPSGAVTTWAQGLSEPTGLCYQNGSLYVADSGSHRILKVTTGAVEVLAGNGAEGMADGAAGQAQFSSPQGVAVDGAGAVYVSDTGNRAVRKVENGEVTTIMAGDPGSLNSYPVSPMGLLITEDTLYVCDNFSRMVLPVKIK